MQIWYIAFLLPIYKFVSCLYNYIMLKKNMDDYVEWLMGSENINDAIITQNAPIVRERIHNSGVKDAYIPITQPTGYGQLATFKTSIINTYPSRCQPYVEHIMSKMHEAIGLYKLGMLDAFNPFYWIKQLLFLPKSILTYLGLTGESIIIKIFQLVYWSLGIVATAIMSLYPEYARSVLEQIFHTL